MTTAPVLSLPAAGRPITDATVLTYAQVGSARKQAVRWNSALIEDPVFGPTSGYSVTVGSLTPEGWPLVWQPLPDEISAATNPVP